MAGTASPGWGCGRTIKNERYLELGHGIPRSEATRKALRLTGQEKENRETVCTAGHDREVNRRRRGPEAVDADGGEHGNQVKVAGTRLPGSRQKRVLSDVPVRGQDPQEQAEKGTRPEADAARL